MACDNKKQMFPPKLEECGNVSSKTPQLAESPQSSGEVLSSPRSPDYPPRVSSDHNQVSTFIPVSSSSMQPPKISMDTAKLSVTTINSEIKSFPSPSVDKIICSPVNIIELQTSVKMEIDLVESVNTKVENTDGISIKSSLNQEQLKKMEIKIEATECRLADDRCALNVKTESKQKNESSIDQNGQSKSHSSSSSKDKRKEHSRHHCTRCYRRSKIKRVNVGVQCKRDRNSISQNHKLLFQSPQKTTGDNLRLNLQTKMCKTLEKQSVKYESLQGLKYKDFIHIETYPNGGATVVHMYQDEIDVLTNEQVEELAQEYFKV